MDDDDPDFDEERICSLCGKPATGFASVNDDWYCHGDDDPVPTCYERAQMPNLDTLTVLVDYGIAEEVKDWKNITEYLNPSTRISNQPPTTKEQL